MVDIFISYAHSARLSLKYYDLSRKLKYICNIMQIKERKLS